MNVNQTILHERKVEAEKDHQQYPQYQGHWDGWGLVQVTKKIKTKMGVAFEKGDIVLCNFAVRFGLKLEAYTTAYSFRNRCNTSIPLQATKGLVAPDFAHERIQLEQKWATDTNRMTHDATKVRLGRES